MLVPMAHALDGSTAQLLRRARAVELLTIAWNVFEALGAILSGLLAGSVALLGFGFDSVIELTSGVVLLWRLSDGAEAERRERIALKIVGVCFFALAAYLTGDSLHKLLSHEAAKESWFGIAVAAASMVAMPLLARAKRQVARQLGSAAMHADSRQTDFCGYLAAVTLGGLLLNSLLRWWWADPAAALIMVPLILREGREALHGKTCCECVPCGTDIPSS